MLDGKRILLIIGGGIAAYKSLELARLIRRRGGEVRAIITKAGQEFVTPLSVGGLTHDKVYTDLFDLTAEADMGHIQLSRDADLLVVCPATADLMAKIAHGRADDMASTALLATDKPVMIVPAMNVRMWEHAATQRNLAQLIADGVSVVGPTEGSMACGEFGPGRLVEPDEIVEAIEAKLGGKQLLAGRKAIVTAGPTHEPIDPVRYIANRSSGKQGYAIAEALARLGADTHLVSGPTALGDPRGVNITRVETAREMLAATEAALPADIAICAAAVADWRADTSTNSKLKKDGSGAVPPLSLVENPDILAMLSAAGPKRPQLVVGFAAETDDVIDHATAKRVRKGCDWIVANDVSPGTGIMGGDSNTVHIITDGAAEHWDPMPKAQVATKLAERVALALTS
ncbi:bifunctional phosphopantothenoylcysteine decarboxylase/phosphopantothenate--cysteine ligase CoaBC [Candidatus Phaeomarinobacter ectocarpi]|uniref:bifunctional phosphopantothenoylcysteine decarboxylase/phosphopantothenate--cysteine ligase CoaBC n=1 Tax=Candidatus Phaeomarinibacter ectocarpi TaxID=1458461 RepID=UPI0005C653B6|nr:bifunctional phosphopantothenoylcysteine decarboxylase/phosphopantothenate--cysteine ligase CoaBC [Candidatus Phaeomarinobacter ectocarpi]